MDLLLREVFPGRKVNRFGPPMIMQVSDMSKFPYGMKNAYRTRSLVKLIESRINGDVIFTENVDGNGAYFAPDLFEIFKELGELYLSNMDVNGNRLLFAINERVRYSLAPYTYNEVIKYDK